MVKTNGVDTARALRARGTEGQLYLSLPAGIISRRALKWGCTLSCKTIQKMDVRTALERCIKQVGKAECYIEIMVKQKRGRFFSQN